MNFWGGGGSSFKQELTVDADDFDHGDGEEGQRSHLHLDQDRRQEEDQQDGRQGTRDPQLLRNPGTHTKP